MSFVCRNSRSAIYRIKMCEINKLTLKLTLTLTDLSDTILYVPYS